MIDFRYHVVSLISVFFALAVGIILGAGPLQASLGDLLSNQVTYLRTELDRQRQQVQVFKDQEPLQENFISQAAPHMLSGTLNKPVALVTLPTTNSHDVQAVSNAVAAAGGKVTKVAAVTEKWYAEQSFSFRQAFSTQLVPYLNNKDAAQVSPGVLLGRALGEALTRADNNTQLLFDLFTADEDGLLTVQNQADGAAQAVIFITSRSSADTTGELSKADKQRLQTQVELAAGLTQATHTVVIGDSQNATDLVWQIRESDAASAVTTVDSMANSISPISAVAALVQEFLGAKPTAYGVGHNAKAVLPQFAGKDAISQAPAAAPAPAPTPAPAANPAPATNNAASKPAANNKTTQKNGETGKQSSKAGSSKPAPSSGKDKGKNGGK